jgi:hypothetical protein
MAVLYLGYTGAIPQAMEMLADEDIPATAVGQRAIHVPDDHEGEAVEVLGSLLLTAPQPSGDEETDENGRPRRNASRVVLAEYATRRGYEVDDEMGRDDINDLIDEKEGS